MLDQYRAREEISLETARAKNIRIGNLNNSKGKSKVEDKEGRNFSRSGTEAYI